MILSVLHDFNIFWHDGCILTSKFNLKTHIMKKLFAVLTAVVLTGFTSNATTTNTIEDNASATTSVRGYGNSFIFVEDGIEFSVFPDGQFDFYMNNYGPDVNVSINTPNASISFNSGYDYNAYVQYDEFGAIIQVEHLPIYYDYYGRVRQVGDVCINYNRFGYVSRVGGLYVHYNRYNRFSHCSGYINTFNRFYVYRPWHMLYRIPSFNHCVVFNRPYRQYYRPIRHHYNRPYANNYRRTTAVASRRGNKVVRHRNLATNYGNTTAHNSTPRPRRSIKNTQDGRSNTQTSTPRPRRDVTNNTPRDRTQTSTPRPRRDVTTTKPRTRTQTSTPKPRRDVTTSKPRTRTQTSTPRPRRDVTSSKPRSKSTQINKTRSVKSRSNNTVAQRSKSSKSRNYSSGSNKNTRRLASNTSRRR